MATIGLSDIHYATITEDNEGQETYGIPQRLAKAISAELSIEIAEAILYADDAAQIAIRDFKNGTLSLNVDDLKPADIANLTGAAIDDNGVLISSTDDGGNNVAIGFKALRPDNTYRYIWFYKCRFGVPPLSLATKGDSISFNTPKIEGIVLRRNKPDANGKHPWRADVTEGTPGVSTATLTSWFVKVYEPIYTGGSING